MRALPRIYPPPPAQEPAPVLAAFEQSEEERWRRVCAALDRPAEEPLSPPTES